MNSSPRTDGIQTVTRLFELLNVLSDRQGAGVTELAEETGLAKSTVHRYLETLVELGYVVKRDQTYSTSLRFLEIGESSRNRRRAYQLAGEKVHELARETNERCQFVVEEHGRAVYCYVSGGDHAVLTDSRIGKRLYMHATSVGKAILAFLPEEEAHAALDRWGMSRRTENTIVDRDELFEELETVRRTHVAFNDEGNIPGLRSVGTPVLHDGEVLGAISISGPSNRMKGEWYEEQIPDLLRGATNELELKLQYGNE